MRAIVVVVLLVVSVVAVWTLPAVAQTENISPVIEPDPTYPVEPVPYDIEPMPDSGDLPGNVGDGQRDGCDGRRGNGDHAERSEAPPAQPVRWAYAGGPLGWVPVWDE